MHKKMKKHVLRGSIATGLMAAATLPAFASSTWVGGALSYEAGLAPLLALGLSALFYLRSSMDA